MLFCPIFNAKSQKPIFSDFNFFPADPHGPHSQLRSISINFCRLQSVSIKLNQFRSMSVSFDQFRGLWLNQERRTLLTSGRWGQTTRKVRWGHRRTVHSNRFWSRIGSPWMWVWPQVPFGGSPTPPPYGNWRTLPWSPALASPPSPCICVKWGRFVIFPVLCLPAYGGTLLSNPSFFTSIWDTHRKGCESVTFRAVFFPASGHVGTPEHCKTKENAKWHIDPVLHSHTLPLPLPPLRGPVAILFISRDTCSDSIAKLFLWVSHNYRAICCKTGYRTDVPVWN